MQPKVVFVTGATSGFGEAFVRKFATSGSKVIITGRRTDHLERLVAEFGRETILPLQFDVRSRAAVQELLTSLSSPFQEIELLINNAGLALGLESAERTDLDDWDTMVDTNIKGLLYVTRVVFPAMVERGRGHVINIGSVAGN